MAIFVIKTKSKLPKCVIVLVVNSLQENEYDFMPLQSMWKISKELMCLSIEWKLKYVSIPTVEKNPQPYRSYGRSRTYVEHDSTVLYSMSKIP